MLFEEQISRKPDLYPWTKDFIDAIWSGFWTPEEFNFTSDYSQFKTEMSEREKQTLVRALSAIGQIEVAVKTFWDEKTTTLYSKYIDEPSDREKLIEAAENNDPEKKQKIMRIITNKIKPRLVGVTIRANKKRKRNFTPTPSRFKN